MARFPEAVSEYQTAYEISNRATWLVKLAASALNFEQQDRAGADPEQDGNAGTLEQHDLREQDRVPPAPNPVDPGSVQHWWKRYLDRAPATDEAMQPGAPRSYFGFR
jgi:alpha-beta hydrolase superfamily lysophospholipase